MNDKMSNQEMDLARQRIYQLLSSLFGKELDRTMVDELNSEQAREFLHQLATQPEFAPQIKQIQEVLADLTTENDLLELAADYCGLFLVGTKHSASPYASLYQGDKEPTIFGQQHQQMLTFLQQNKLQLNSDFAEPADHLAVILAYAGHLAINGDEKEQLAYLENYLSNWLGAFVAQIEKTDSGGFYTALAQLALAWVQSEEQWLGSI